MSQEIEKTQTKSIAELNYLKQQSIEIANECKNISVTDATTSAIATQIVSKAKSYIKEIEEKGSGLYTPFYKAYKELYDLTKDLASPLKKSVKIAGDKILVFKQAEEKKRQEAIKKIETLNKQLTDYAHQTMSEINDCKTEAELGVVYKNRIKGFDAVPYELLGAESLKKFIAQLVEYGKAKRQAILNPIAVVVAAEAQEETAVEITETIEESIGQSLAVNDQKVSGIKRTWTFEIVDKEAMPKSWLMPDEAAIKATMKMAIETGKLKPGDDDIVNGVRFYQKESLNVR